MRRTMMWSCCLLALAATPAGAELPEWLVGDWSRPTRGGRLVESWRAAGPRTLEGEVRFVGPDGTGVQAEALLLAEMGDAIFYIPRPRENPLPVAFRLVEKSERRLIFENPEHDFPTRIGYELGDDGALLAWIAGPGDDGDERRIDFRYAPVTAP